MKFFKDFCAYKIHSGIYGDTYFGHAFQDGMNKHNVDFKLLGKDLSFIINPELHIRTQDGHEKRLERFKQSYTEVADFSKKMTPEKFLTSDIAVELKMDMMALNPGLNLKHVLGIGKQFSTENVWIAGDGYDWGEGEYTSGHESEIIIKVDFGNKEQFLNEYNQWSSEKSLQIIAKKEAKSLNKIKP